MDYLKIFIDFDFSNSSTIFFSSEYFKQMPEEIEENSFLFACFISLQIGEIGYMQLEIENQINLKVLMNYNKKIENLFSRLIGNFFNKKIGIPLTQFSKKIGTIRVENYS